MQTIPEQGTKISNATKTKGKTMSLIDALFKLKEMGFEVKPEDTAHGDKVYWINGDAFVWTEKFGFCQLAKFED